MYWDIVEVRAEAGLNLWVRFEDGVEGTVHLDPAELTGVLSPLRDPEFFALVSLDDGVPCWPGNLDLAPDGLYHQVTEVRAKGGTQSSELAMA